jgi:hypothetical protein
MPRQALARKRPSIHCSVSPISQVPRIQAVPKTSLSLYLPACTFCSTEAISLSVFSIAWRLKSDTVALLIWGVVFVYLERFSLRPRIWSQSQFDPRIDCRVFELVPIFELHKGAVPESGRSRQDEGSGRISRTILRWTNTLGQSNSAILLLSLSCYRHQLGQASKQFSLDTTNTMNSSY